MGILETVYPPVFGKEGAMSLLFKRFKFVSLFLLLLVVFTPLFGNEGSVAVFVNDNLYKEFSFSSLAEYSSPVVDKYPFILINQNQISEAAYPFGITLSELLPIMDEAWLMEIDINNKKSEIKDFDLAEKLSTYFLIIGEIRFDKSIILNESSIKIKLTGEISDDKSLEVWISWEGINLLKKEIERFAAIHNVTIKSLEVPKISSKLIQTQRGGGKVPDVVMIQSDYVNDLVVNNTIQSLNYMDLGSFSNSGIKSFSLYGNQWAIPFYFDSQAIICNTDVLKKINVNDFEINTLEDLEFVAQQINEYSAASKEKIVPLSWNLYSAYWFLPFQYGFGKKHLVEEDASVIVTDEPTVEAMTYLLSLIDRALLSANERDAMLSNFISGRTAMMLSASYMVEELEKAKVSFKIVPFPFNERSNFHVSPILDYKGLAITKRSKNPILARRLIQHLTSLGTQYRLIASLDKLPGVVGALEIDEFDSQLRKDVKRSAQQGQYIPPDPSYGIYKNTLWSTLRLIIERQLTVNEGLFTTEKLISKQIEELIENLPIEFKNYYKTNKGVTTKDVNKEKTFDESDSGSSTGRRSFFDWLRQKW